MGPRRLVNKKLKKYCWLHKSSDLVKKNIFGLGKPDPKLLDRIGDYTLIMKENYIIKDNLLGRKSYAMKGNHGGVSPDEMIVPLVIIDIK